MLENETLDTIELDDDTKAEVVTAIKKSLNGEQITDHQAGLLFYWARHQNDRMFNFVPKQYRLNVATPKSRKRKTPAGK